ERLQAMEVEKGRHPETIVHLSRHFGISYLAMYHRLRAEGKIDLSAADYKDVRPLGLARKLGYAPSSQEHGHEDWSLEDRLPQRYIELAHKALGEGAISKRRAAEVLGISPLQLEDRMEEEAAPMESPEAYHGLQ
ncbi:MAG: transcriptional regulator, partial [Bacteroidetes bacterium QS_1_65_9]